MDIPCSVVRGQLAAHKTLIRALVGDPGMLCSILSDWEPDKQHGAVHRLNPRDGNKNRSNEIDGWYRKRVSG